MSAETDLFTALSAWSPLAALVGTRIYPDALPEAAQYPAIVYERTETVPVITTAGINFGATVSNAITAWGASRTAVAAIGNEVVNALIAAGFGYVSRKSGFDPDSNLFADIVGVEQFETP